MPGELVDPLVRLRHVPRWPVEHTSLETTFNHRSRLFNTGPCFDASVNHESLVGIDKNGVPHVDAGVLRRIKVELYRTRKTKSWPCSLVHLEILTFPGIVQLQHLHLAPPEGESCRAVDKASLPKVVSHQGCAPLLDSLQLEQRHCLRQRCSLSR